MLELTIIKEYRDEKTFVLEEIKHGFYILRVGASYICVRKNGNVILDSVWHRKTNNQQKHILKEFLGGMYIQEIKKDISKGHFKIGDLDEILSY